MKRLLCVLMTLALLLTAAVPAAALSAGDNAPQWTLTTLDGRSINDGTYADKVQLLVFFRGSLGEDGVGRCGNCNNLIKKLKKDPEAKAILCGFADRETGTADGNWILSENRSNIVSEALQAAGIDPSRIECYWYGDTERISKVPEKNRATVLLTK